MSEKPHTPSPSAAPRPVPAESATLYVAAVFTGFWILLLAMVGAAVFSGEAWLGRIAARDSNPIAQAHQAQMWAVRRVINPASAQAQANAGPLAQAVAAERAAGESKP